MFDGLHRCLGAGEDDQERHEQVTSPPEKEESACRGRNGNDNFPLAEEGQPQEHLGQRGLAVGGEKSCKASVDGDDRVGRHHVLGDAAEREQEDGEDHAEDGQRQTDERLPIELPPKEGEERGVARDERAHVGVGHDRVGDGASDRLQERMDRAAHPDQQPEKGGEGGKREQEEPGAGGPHAEPLCGVAEEIASEDVRSGPQHAAQHVPEQEGALCPLPRGRR